MTDGEINIAIEENVFKRIACEKWEYMNLGAAGGARSMCDCTHDCYSLDRTLIHPLYSTNIQAAWLIFDKLGGLHGISYTPNRKDWTAYFQVNIDHPICRASDKTAAKSICLAALKAVGVEIK